MNRCGEQYHGCCDEWDRADKEITKLKEELEGEKELYQHDAKEFNKLLAEKNALVLQIGLAQKLAEAASCVLSPCDDSEKERGYCVGHGGITRLPCEFAELQAALDAFRGKA